MKNEVMSTFLIIVIRYKDFKALKYRDIIEKYNTIFAYIN